jgi:riboflavin synthase
VFTGIIEELGTISLVQPDRLVIKARRTLEGTGIGDSMCVNGVCLTVVELGADRFTVEVVPETLRRSNLGMLKTGDAVNLERPLAFGGRLGGHLVEGHVDNTGTIVSERPEGGATIVRFQTTRYILRYLVEKGFVAIDGISLTVVEKDQNSFSISLIPHTRQNTTLGKKKVGDTVNLEVDIIAKYVEALVKPSTGGITADFLQEHGFTVN